MDKLLFKLTDGALRNLAIVTANIVYAMGNGPLDFGKDMALNFLLT